MKTTPVFALLALALFVALAQPAAAEQALPLKPVQIFDVEAGKVVRTIDNDDDFQRIAKGWLKSVTGLSPKVKPEDKCGFVYRVPLTRPESVRIGQQTVAVDDVFLFHCPDTEPILLVFDPARKPYLLKFKADLKPFLRKVAAP